MSRNAILALAVVLAVLFVLLAGLVSDDAPGAEQTRPVDTVAAPAVEPLAPSVVAPPKLVAAASPSRDGGFIIHGVVRDSRGAPVPGAAVEGFIEGAEFELETDSAGAYSTGPLEPGEWSLVVSSDGHVTSELEHALVADVALDFTLEEGADLGGVVVDAKGKPVEHAEIEVLETRDYETTDERGAFTLVDVPMRELELEVAADGFEPLRHKTHPPNGGLRLVLKRIPGAEHQLRGVVVDVKGAPVEGAAVHARAHSPLPEGASQSGHARTAADGHFEIDGLHAGTYGLSVYKDGWEPHEQMVATGPELRRIQLKAMPMVSGRVVNAAGQPVQRFEVQLASGKQQVEDAAGRFRVPVRARSGMQLYVNAEGYAEKRVYINPTKVDVDVGEVVLTAGRVIEGRVVDAQTGEPLADADVNMSTAVMKPDQLFADAAGMVVATTDAEGRFSLRVDPQIRVLLGHHPAYVPAIHQLGSNESSVTLRLERGRVVDLTVLDEHGQPAKGRLHPTLGGGFRMTPFHPRSDGVYRLEGLAPGSALTLIFFPEGSTALYRPLRVAVTAQDQKLVYRPALDGATISLQLTNGELGRFRGYLHGEDQSKYELRDGRFTHVVPGSYTLVLLSPEERAYARFPVTTTPQAQQTITLTLPDKLEPMRN